MDNADELRTVARTAWMVHAGVRIVRGPGARLARSLAGPMRIAAGRFKKSS